MRGKKPWPTNLADLISQAMIMHRILLPYHSNQRSRNFFPNMEGNPTETRLYLGCGEHDTPMAPGEIMTYDYTGWASVRF
jgi:hypothetical protein